MTQDRSVLIDQEQRLLAERVKVFRSFYDAIMKDPEAAPQDPLNKIWPFIEAFDQQVGATAKRLQNLTSENVSRSQLTSTLGYFQKQLRRLLGAHRDLSRLSEAIALGTRPGRMTLLRMYDDDRAVDAELRELFLTGDLRRMTADALEELFRLHVPAIVAAQACVYAAVMCSITEVIAKLRTES